MKVVIDTNLFVAAYFNKNSASAKILEMAARNELQFLWTEKIKREAKCILANIKAKKFLKNLPGIFKKKNQVVPRIKIKEIKEDPEDDKFLECAVGGKAEIIVSSDRHLLKVREFQGIPILTPTNALNFLKNSKI